MELVFYVPVAACPGRQGGRVGVAVAGNEVDDLDGLLPLLRDRAAQLGDLGGAGEPDPGRRQRDRDGAPGAPAVSAINLLVLNSAPSFILKPSMSL